MVSNISNAEFKEKMNDGNHIVIDVRTPAEVAQGVISNPLHIDVNNPSFGQKVSELEKDKSYLIYCRSGGRSAMACQLMERNGFENVFNLANGIMGWDGDIMEFSGE